MEGVTATNGKEKVMFEHKTEEEARKEILSMVEGYYRAFHAKKEDFREGDRISYAARVYDQDEMCNLVDSALEFWLTSGRYTEQFEKELADYIGVRFCSLVNSGSSANLLAFMALTSPLLGERRVKRGDEIITVAAGFPTTVTPYLQYGAVPVFLDRSSLMPLHVRLPDQQRGYNRAHRFHPEYHNRFRIHRVLLTCQLQPV